MAATRCAMTTKEGGRFLKMLFSPYGSGSSKVISSPFGFETSESQCDDTEKHRMKNANANEGKAAHNLHAATGRSTRTLVATEKYRTGHNLD
ncbi:hypothetical protein NDU88_001945 [Pleurodeles waltl]|uniref:Uncharacterized protein n=1 Tax=Pleurodeles waltl TaxID=8319 RepID=A0AAV7WN24_PLEWA|nr:hypothetical protein NDU88_001945 [Pleurodeles waltl]